jgi:hypothetical protein
MGHNIETGGGGLNDVEGKDKALPQHYENHKNRQEYLTPGSRVESDTS